MKSKGAMIAALAAGLLGSAAPFVASAADGAKDRCQGANSCKGKGWIELSEKECKEKGGKPMK